VSWFSVLVGVALLVLLVWDVHVTVFVPRGPAGPVAGRLYRWAWDAWRSVCGTRSAHARRRLAALGPLLVPVTVTIWALMLLIGFALMMLPFAGKFLIEGAVAFPPWFSALYVSGYSVTTLGVGDVIPQGMPLRLIMIFASACGFLLISIAVTYLLSVYASLDRMTSLAFDIHRFIGRVDGETPATLLVRATQADGDGELRSWLAGTASTLAQVVQDENEFPLLHYFHMPDERSLPLALTDLMQVVTLCRSMLSPDAYPSLARGLVTAGTERTIRGYFTAMTRRYRQEKIDDAAVERDREASFAEAWQTLRDAGVRVRPRDDAWDAYVQFRQRWDGASMQLRLRFGYPTGDAWRDRRETNDPDEFTA